MTSKEPALNSSQLVKEARSFYSKKELGQHFLVDADKLEQIAESLGAEPGDDVIEIGPGIGFLTRFLTRRGAHVTAIDLDRESIAYLKGLNLQNLTLKHGDFLHFDLNTLEFYRKDDGARASSQHSTSLKIAGNVPYQITGRIIGHIFGEIGKPSPWISRIEQIVLLVQREVAERMVARPGESEYSKISLHMQYFCNVEKLSTIPPESFLPPPRVTSTIVRLTPHKTPIINCSDHLLLKHVIEAGFRQRRKMLRNSLGFLQLSQSQIDQTFSTLGFDPQVRPERLSLQQFAMLTDAVVGKCKTAP